jgi:hypothetical protein
MAFTNQKQVARFEEMYLSVPAGERRYPVTRDGQELWLPKAELTVDEIAVLTKQLREIGEARMAEADTLEHEPLRNGFHVIEGRKKRG